MSEPNSKHGDAPATAPLTGLTILSLESRRASEMAQLIRRSGATAISAPSMREVPLGKSQEALEFLRRLEAGEVDVVLLLTGVGTRALVDAVAERCSAERFAELLGRVKIVARGPKPVAALRQLQLTPDVTVPEPNTWRDILTTLDEHVPVKGCRVAVQEYGRSNEELLEGLRQRGAHVLRVPVYRWDLPEDIGPLENAVRRIVAGDVDVMLFTSARQVDHLLEIARRLDLEREVAGACGRILIASIGPVCSEALRANGLPVDLEPEHPKMGHLVKALREQARRRLEAKRAVLTRSSPSRS